MRAAAVPVVRLTDTEVVGGQRLVEAPALRWVGEEQSRARLTIP